MNANNQKRSLVMKETVEIPAKRYSGHIRKPEIIHATDKAGKKLYNQRDNSPIEYVRFDIETDVGEEVHGWDGVFKNVSVPANLTKNSMLGLMLARLELLPESTGQEFQMKDLDGLHVSFDSEIEVTANGGRFTKPVIASFALAKKVPA